MPTHYRGIVTVSQDFAQYFRLVRHGKPNENSRDERYYYHGRTARNLKVIVDYPLEEIQGKVAMVNLSWDENAKRPEGAPQLSGKAASAQGFWRMYLYPIETQPDGTPAHSSHTIFISFTDLPVNEELLAAYKRFDLYPVGTLLFGEKTIPAPKARILAVFNKLQQILEAGEVNPIALIQTEQRVKEITL